ncbi:uncharacterized protein LOC134432769 [Melospiza melodia melodia]|uniref:uncharacterized protein LOC134432769 n=1 Tax=Melospiza melodia melodia TaxID=1914991 RepID=UPI002FD4D991
MEPQEVLEALVAVVATLGEVAAAVTGSHRDEQQCMSPEFLHTALRNFTWSLRETLDHSDVTSLGHPGVPSLGQALTAFGATPGAIWADVRAVDRAWWKLEDALGNSWGHLYWEAIHLCNACEDMANAQAGDPQDKDEATHRGTAGDNLAATAQQLMVALDRDEEASAGATRDAQVAMATNEAMGEAVVASRRARAAIRRRHWAEVALEPLQRLVAMCDEAGKFITYISLQFMKIMDALEGTNEAPPNVPVALVAKAERVWDASARLFMRHLLGTLGDIHDLLLSPYDGRGGPNGPSSRAVAERCQKAIEDIPNLLQGQ